MLSPEVLNHVEPVVASLKRQQIQGGRATALAVAQMLMKVISTVRWTYPSELIAVIREVGVVLERAQPRDLIPGNIVRRVLAIIREETDADAHDKDPMVLLMFSLLSTHKTGTNEPMLKSKASDLRQVIIQGIRELIDNEITNVYALIEPMLTEMIHDNETLLVPTPTLEIILKFLIKARLKRKFTVLVPENYPNHTQAAHAFVKQLGAHDIDTVLIADTTIYAVMLRVGKVIIGALGVCANGGCLLNAGVGYIVECAKEFKTPVCAVAGLYKLSPVYPYNSMDLVEMGNAGKVLPYSESQLVDSVAAVGNPLTDYVSPDNIDIYITNLGGFAPSFIYRIVLDNYRPDDNDLKAAA